MAAHAGIEPEHGRSAVVAAARAVAAHAARPHRRGDDGQRRHRPRAARPTNIVPEHCVLEGEARSRDAGAPGGAGRSA